MSGANALPQGFESLEPFVNPWAMAADGNERARLRGARPEAERLAFYDASKALLPAALSYLDAKPLGQFDEKEKRLMRLLLSFAHVSLAVEVQGDGESGHTPLRDSMPITRASADT